MTRRVKSRLEQCLLVCGAPWEIGGEATAEAVAWLSSMLVYHEKPGRRVAHRAMVKSLAMLNYRATRQSPASPRQAGGDHLFPRRVTCAPRLSDYWALSPSVDQSGRARV